jgi:peptide/nickel transport system substrate-binding protein
VTAGRAWLAALATLALVLVAGAPPAAAAPAPRVLRVAYADDVASLDPDNAFPLFGLDALRVMYQGLVQYAPGATTLTGWLAQSWTISADRRTYVFHLHDGVRFHDGHAMGAPEVLAAFRRRATPVLALSYFLDNVEAMSAPDRLTFVIRLKAPEPEFLHRLASPWGPKVVGPGALVGHAGADQAASWLSGHEDGTGPYRLAAFDRGYRYVLVRDPAYWGPRPYFDRIEIEIIPSASQQMLMVRRGDLDLMLHGYPFDQLSHLPPPLKALAYDDLGLEMAYVNPWRNLKDRDVRWAVVAAINPAFWLRDDFAGWARPARALYPRMMVEGPAPVRFPTDLARARRIIAAHAPVRLEIGYGLEEAGTQQRTAELMASALRRIGVTATIRGVPNDQEPNLREAPLKAPDLWLGQNYPDAAWPSTQANVFFQTGAPLNFLGYSNPAIDRLIDAAGLIEARGPRDAAYLRISDALFADLAFIPLADIKDVIVYRDGLEDLNPRPAMPWSVDFATIRRR